MLHMAGKELKTVSSRSSLPFFYYCFIYFTYLYILHIYGLNTQCIITCFRELSFKAV